MRPKRSRSATSRGTPWVGMISSDLRRSTPRRRNGSMSPSDPAAAFRYGQIVLATVGDGRGNTKTRPVVIVTPTDDITGDLPVLAVCISTQDEEPMPPEHVALPWSNPRHPRTGLNKPNVAKCNWIVAVHPASIIEA